MRVETRTGGDGVQCWNAQAIAGYVGTVNAREERLSTDNPDLTVTPGLIKCYGCEVMEYDLGTRCTATLTRTLYAVRGEVGPRREDAAGSLTEIPGLVSRLDAEPAVHSAGADPGAGDMGSRRAGLRGLLSRLS